jgi:hypothetical protein
MLREPLIPSKSWQPVIGMGKDLPNLPSILDTIFTIAP